MNWYKQSQSDIQKSRDLGMNYMDVGHSTEDDEFVIQEKFYRKSARNYLWWWDGSLKVKSLTSRDMASATHGDYINTEEYYAGRAQIIPGGKRLVSILKPDNRRYFSVPSVILRALYQKFGDNIQIIDFDY